MKPTKLLLLIATLWLTAYTGGVLVDVDLGDIVNWATTGLYAVLVVVYIVHVWSNGSFTLTGAKRILWTLAFLGFAPLAMPVYFVLHVLPGEPSAS